MRYASTKRNQFLVYATSNLRGSRITSGRIEKPKETIGPKLDSVGLSSRQAVEVRHTERVRRIVESPSPDLRIDFCPIISTNRMRASHLVLPYRP